MRNPNRRQGGLRRFFAPFVAISILAPCLSGCGISGKAKLVDGRPETPIQFFKRIIVAEGGSLANLSETEQPDTRIAGGSLGLGRGYTWWNLRDYTFDYCQSIGGNQLSPQGACLAPDGHGLFLLHSQIDSPGLDQSKIHASMIEPKTQPSPGLERYIGYYKSQAEAEIKGYGARARAKQEAEDAAPQRSLDLYATMPIGTLLCADIQWGINKGKLKAYVEAKQDGSYQLRLAGVDGIRESDRYRYQDSRGNSIWLTIGEIFWEPPLGWLPCNR